MTQFKDQRGLTLCYQASDGSILLRDELKNGDYASEFKQVPCDVELLTFRLTGERGNANPQTLEHRNALRNAAAEVLSKL